MQGLGEILAATNAALNATTAVLLFAARRAAKRHDAARHKALMVRALATSALFLVTYATRVGLTGTHRFVGAPWLRATYLVVLGTHTVLAMTLVGLVPATVVLGLRGKTAAHRRLARITWPIWMYVSVTGVAVYVMLYHLAG